MLKGQATKLAICASFPERRGELLMLSSEAFTLSVRRLRKGSSVQASARRCTDSAIASLDARSGALRPGQWRRCSRARDSLREGATRGLGNGVGLTNASSGRWPSQAQVAGAGAGAAHAGR
jgi:hypothetical protein